jgi:hypothetical protein
MTNPTRPLHHVPRLLFRTLRLGDLEQSLQLLPPHIGLDDGQPARNCFEHQPPRLFFNASQRRLLCHASFDDGDAALMAQLDGSTHDLKKLWRGVYDRIEDTAPEVLGDARADDDGKRGPEKRRQVLACQRQRPEELRPWARG